MAYAAAALFVICLVLLVDRHLERTSRAQREKEWSLERAALLQRIQAPEVAITEYASPIGDEELQYAHFDDDDEFAD
jgi:hypothetical protein